MIRMLPVKTAPLFCVLLVDFLFRERKPREFISDNGEALLLGEYRSELSISYLVDVVSKDIFLHYDASVMID